MLTGDEFRDHLDQFIETSNRLKDGWFVDTIRNQTFLRKKSVFALNLVDTTREEREVEDTRLLLEGKSQVSTHITDRLPPLQCAGILEEEDICEDDKCLAPSSVPVQSVTYEYHVLYSESYAVPVLYLNALDSTGKRISLDRVWDLCPDTFQPYLRDNRWTTLTQQEHPLLGIPFLMLHPCHTADLMSQISQEPTTELKVKGNYLVTWLSAVGPLVGLTLSKQYAVPSIPCEKKQDVENKTCAVPSIPCEKKQDVQNKTCAVPLTPCEKKQDV